MCPSCAIKARSVNYTKLMISKNGTFGECFPNLLEDWDYEKNKIDPFSIARFSETKVWWKCHACGFEWQSAVHNVASGRRCKKCANKRRGQYHSKAVKQFTLNGELVNEFTSITEAMRITKARSIAACCKGKCKSSGGFIWRFSDEVDTVKCDKLKE